MNTQNRSCHYNETSIMLISFYNFISSVVFAKGPPPGTGVGDVKANIMIMLDDSGSMSSTDPSAGMVIIPME